MNIEKLKQAETLFLRKYPNGFMHPEMQAIGKKHKMEQLIKLTQESFTKPKFKDNKTITEDMAKIVGRSSMVSMFEKPKFKDFIRQSNDRELKLLGGGLKDFLHGNQQKGFEAIADVLRTAKLAKWSLITILPNYYFPNKEVFVKPTTAKGVINYFELEDLDYKPTPTWAFYEKYRDTIQKMKGLVDDSISPSNAAFGGFLMMSI